MTRKPLYFLVVLVTLGLGIGASSAIFALVHGLLRPLPFADSERLVTLWSGQPKEGLEKLHVSPPDFEDWEDQNQTFESIAAFYPETFNLSGEEAAERVFGAKVSSRFFHTLGVDITTGRDFTEDPAGGPERDVVMLSHALWESRYGADPGILGDTIRVNGAPHTVIGVVPENLALPRRARLWTPLIFEEMNTRRDARSLEVIARLKPGIDLTRAQQEMDTIAARLGAAYPASNEGWIVSVVPLLDELVGDTRAPLWVLVGAVALLLLITCVNVAGLLLARGLERAREVAVRQAFGASRKRILLQLLMENLVLAIAASLLGIFIAWGLLTFFGPMLPSSLARPSQAGINAAALGFALFLGVGTTLLFGLVPAVRASRSDLANTLKQGGRSASEKTNLVLRHGLVVGEFALTFALLVTTLLLGRSFMDLMRVDPGFESENVVTARVGIDPARYQNPLQINGFFTDLMERVSSLPGVKSVAAVDALPLAGSTEGTVFLPEGDPMPTPGEQPITRLTVVSHDYFQTLEIPLLKGRDFEPADTSIDPDCECVAPDTVPTVIINQTMARKYWPGEDPVGQRMKLGDLESDLMFEIVGMVQDVRYDGLVEPVLPRVYVYHGQFPVPTMNLAIRTAGDSMALIPAVRRELQDLDSEIPAYGVRTLESMVERSVARPRLMLALIGAFTLIALTLSAVGLYGVMSTSVAQRTKEYGIHIALGSRGERLVWMVVRRALVLGLGGIVLGVGLALATGSLLASLLTGVEQAAPTIFLIAGAVLTGVTLLGALLPAFRVARLDPLVALRYE